MRVSPISADDHVTPNVTVGPDGTATAVFPIHLVPDWVMGAATRVPGSDAFSDPVRISPIGDPVKLPEIASAPDGTTTATWIYADLQEGDERHFVQSATRPSGAEAFSPAINISETPPTSDENTPQIAVGPDGTTVVVWVNLDESGRNVVQASTRPAGSTTFGSPENVSKPANEALGPEVAIGPDGNTTVVWSTSDPESGDKFQVQAATRPAGSTTFGQPIDLSSDGPWASEPEVAVGPDGTTTVVWNLGNLPTASEQIVQYAMRPAGSEAFGEPRDVFSPAYRSAPRRTPNLDYRYPQVVTGPTGTTTVAWQRVVEGDSVIQASSKLAGAASFSKPVNLSTSAYSSTEPQLAVAPCGGLLTATWDSYLQPDPEGNVQTEVQTTSQRTECKAALANPKVSAPKNVPFGKKVTFKVTVTNIGDNTATAVSLNAKGNGVKSRKEDLGSLTPGASRVVNLQLSFGKRGNTEVTFTLSSKNAGKGTAKKTVKVK